MTEKPTLQERVRQFGGLSLPGQPQGMHMGTSYLVSDLNAALKEAREWLDASLGLVDGRGPPNWDGIRDFLKRTE